MIGYLALPRPRRRSTCCGRRARSSRRAHGEHRRRDDARCSLLVLAARGLRLERTATSAARRQAGRGQAHRRRLRARDAQARRRAARRSRSPTPAPAASASSRCCSGSRILGEKENLVAGLSGSFTHRPAAGPVLARPARAARPRRPACVTVGGTAPSPAPTTRCCRPRSPATALRPRRRRRCSSSASQPFVAAVKAGDVEEAKAQFAAARAPYETIEPVAESFGNLDPGDRRARQRRREGRAVDGLPPHRAGAVGKKHTTKGMEPIADKLLADVQDARGQDARRSTYQPDELANGANGLLGRGRAPRRSPARRTATRTPTSPTSRPTSSGSQTTFGLLAPALQGQGPGAGERRSAARFDAVQQELATLKQGGAFPSYDTVDDAERKQLSDARRRARQADRADLGRARRLIRARAALARRALGARGRARARGDDPTAALLDDFARQYRQAVVRPRRGARGAAAHRDAAAERGGAHAGARAAASARCERPATRCSPWPLAATVDRLVAAARRGGASAAAGARPDGTAASARGRRGRTRSAGRAGERRSARRPLGAEAYAHAHAAAAARRRRVRSTPRSGRRRAAAGVLTALDRRARRRGRAATGRATRSRTAQQTLGDVHISRGTVVADAAILVFREGLEAVLILAAITASFVGARRRLRRPVLLGGLAGIGATAVTWVLAQLLVSELGTGGLRLEAITGAARDRRAARRHQLVLPPRLLEPVDRALQPAAQAARGGRLPVRAGGRARHPRPHERLPRGLRDRALRPEPAGQRGHRARACWASAIGLAATLAVGGVTFALQRKLPYRRMLIATGVLIALVLGGDDRHHRRTSCRASAGCPSTPTGFTVPLWANSWLGIYATWEGIALPARRAAGRGRLLRRRARAAGPAAPLAPPRRGAPVAK